MNSISLKDSFRESKDIHSSREYNDKTNDKDQYIESKENIIKKYIDQEMNSAIKKEDKLSKGDKVIARNDLLGYYYYGKALFHS